MAVVASDRLTLATLPSPSYVRTFYLKQSSTLNPPGVPATNPPGDNWSTTEPTFSPNETATVYTVMLTAYGTVSFEYGPVQKSSSFEAAKQAYNQAVASGKSADDAYQKALDAQNDLANLQIGGRNYLLNSAQMVWPFRIATNSSATSPLQQGTDEIGQWLTGTSADTGEFSLSTYANPMFESGRGDVFSEAFFPQPDVYTQSVEVMSEVSMTVRLGSSGDFAPIQPNVWTQVYRTFTPSDNDASRLRPWGPTVFATPDVPVGTKLYLRNWKLERGNKATGWTPAPEDVDAGIVAVGDKAKADLDALEVGTRNLIIRSTETENTWIDTTGAVSPNNNNSTSDYIRIPDSGHLTLTRTHTPGDAYFRISWYDENKVFISRGSSGLTPTTLSPSEDVAFMRVSYPKNAQVKAERGTKATDWTPAPEDVDAEAQAKADVAKQGAIDVAKADLDALEVGGRNLYQQAGGEYLTTWNTSYDPEIVVEDGRRAFAFNSSNDIIYTGRRGAPVIGVGETITFSFWAKGSRPMTFNRVYLGNGAGNTLYPSDAFVTEEWQRFSYTYTVTNELEMRVHMYPKIRDYSEDGEIIGYATFFLTDMKLERGSKATDWTPAQEDVDSGINDALTKAEDALSGLATRPTKTYVDDQIIQSANGKNSITTSLNAPSGDGVENGDLWRRHDSAGHVYQEFTWRDGSWKPTMVTSQMVTNMDIHKLTVSGDASFTTLVADEIWSKIVRARLVVATELIAGDAIVKNTLSADRLKAKTITADSGVIDDLAIKEAHIGNASVTNAKIKDIDAGKITAGYIDSARIDARTITTEKLLLGSFDNFFHDPRFEDERGYSPGVVVGETLRINAGQTVNVSWLAMPVDKDESYTVRFRKTGSGNLTFAIHSATTPSGPYSLVGESFNTATEAGDFEFTVTADKPYIRWVASNLTAQSFISEIKIRKVFTGIRLEDGIITTEKIQSGAVVAESIQADSITSEHMGANSVWANSIGADQITGHHIGADTITGEHIMAESITAVNIEAEAITTDKLHAHSVTYDKIELGAVRGDNLSNITKDQFMSAIDDDLSGIINSAETISDSVIITPGEIRLTTEVKSSGTTTNETALSLTSTRQTFIVDGKDVVYIDSEEESMNIRNVVVDDSIRVGNHIIEKISDDITAFMWAGDR